MSFTLAGASLAKLVVAHDTRDSNAEDLLEPYSTDSDSEIPEAIWWFYCAGLGIALACTGIIAAAHSMRTIENARLTRPYRLSVRFAVSIVLILLPLARDHLSSLDVVATTSCLVVFVLFVELAGSTCSGDAFWGFWEKRECHYSTHARMSKKELEEKVRTGEVINVEELARSDTSKGNVNQDIIV
jgi:hypothetical protein